MGLLPCLYEQKVRGSIPRADKTPDGYLAGSTCALVIWINETSRQSLLDHDSIRALGSAADDSGRGDGAVL